MSCIGCMPGIRVGYFDQNFESELVKDDEGSKLIIYKYNGDKLIMDISFCPWCGKDLRTVAKEHNRKHGDYRKTNYRQTQALELS